MAKPFVICHSEETVKRDRIALVALIRARVYLCRSRALYFHYYISLLHPLSFHRSIRQQCGERGELCIICSKIAAIIADRLILLANSNGHHIQWGSILITIECTDGLKNACLQKHLHDALSIRLSVAQSNGY